VGQDSLVVRVHRVNQDSRVKLEIKVRWAIQDFLVHLAIPALRVHRVSLDRRDSREYGVQVETQERKDRSDSLELTDLQDKPVVPE